MPDTVDPVVVTVERIAGVVVGWLGTISRVIREYDAQLLESVAVRRGRLRESLLWGRAHRKRATVDNLKRFAISIVVAAVLCAGCVGWSFVKRMLVEQQRPQHMSRQVVG
jgi:hypothetical protein